MIHPHITLGTILRWLGVLLVAGGFVWYVLWQSRIFIIGPALTIHTKPPAVTSSSTVALTGNAQNIVWIRLNDRNIVTTPDGDFKEYITLERGYTIIELSAADRFGRTTEHYFPVVHQPASSTASSTEASLTQ